MEESSKLNTSNPAGFSIRDDFARVRKDFTAQLDRRRKRNILATALGPKVVGGKLTDELSLQVLVDQKRASRELGTAYSVPSRFADLTTDILDSRGALANPTMMVAPSERMAVGYGVELRNTRSRPATAGFGAIDSSGRRVITCAAHFCSINEPIQQGRQRERVIGLVSERVNSLPGIDVYGRRARFPQERFSIDTALIRLRPRVYMRRGLPGNQEFCVPSESNRIINGLVGRDVMAFGQGTGGWRTGTVLGMFPRRTTARVTGFCLVEHHPVSRGGDSGSLWLAKSRAGFVAVGTHWGLIGAYAFLIDAAAIFRCFKLRGHYGLSAR